MELTGLHLVFPPPSTVATYCAVTPGILQGYWELGTQIPVMYGKQSTD